MGRSECSIEKIPCGSLRCRLVLEFVSERIRRPIEKVPCDSLRCHLLEEAHHGHLIFICGCKDSELFIAVLGHSEDAFDVLFLVLHVVSLVVGAHEPYRVCAFVNCCCKSWLSQVGSGRNCTCLCCGWI